MSDPDPQFERRKQEAAAREAEAKADQAEAEAREAKAVADKAAADAREAEAKAAHAESDVAQVQRDAEARKAIDEANKAAAAARAAQLGSVVPDFGSVKDSTLDIKGDQIEYTVALSAGALDKIGKSIAGQIKPPSDATWRVLITSKQDLVSADAVYVEVKTSLKQLKDQADSLIELLNGSPFPAAPPGGFKTAAPVTHETVDSAAALGRYNDVGGRGESRPRHHGGCGKGRSWSVVPVDRS